MNLGGNAENETNPNLADLRSHELQMLRYRKRMLMVVGQIVCARNQLGPQKISWREEYSEKSPRQSRSECRDPR